MAAKAVETRDTARLEHADLLAFHRRNYLAQRIGWAVLAVFLAAAGLGLFGGGGILDKSHARAEGVEVEYARFVRRGGHSSLTLRVAAGAVPGTELRVRLNRAFVERVRFEAITPTPMRAQAAGEEIVYVIAAQPHVPVIVMFHFQAERAGPLSARVALESGPSVAFAQFIYP